MTMDEAVSSKGWPGLELEGPRLHRAGRQAATAGAHCPPESELRSGMARPPKSCWPQTLVTPLGVPWGGCCGQSSGLTPGTGYSMDTERQEGCGAWRGVPLPPTPTKANMIPHGL